MATCNGCGASVSWRTNTKTGKAAPVNMSPAADGNVILVGTNEYRVLKKAEVREGVQGSLLGELSEERFTLHFATCPKSKHFRSCRKCHKTPCECAT